ncbi:hypothetical protein Adt_12877 [Abeliophyllum distichum]|uniref:Uncharacterized protein n=1 Tax=Abeliophyllum distichum TaxID=126358 RepID=A0ABD1TV84_9LAMI
MILTNIAYYFIPLVSVMFAGHLGELDHRVAVSGFALMVKSLQILSILSALITGLTFAIASLASSLKSKVQPCLFGYLWVPQKVQPHMYLKQSPPHSCRNSGTYYPLITAISTSISFISFFFTTVDRPASII